MLRVLREASEFLQQKVAEVLQMDHHLAPLHDVCSSVAKPLILSVNASILQLWLAVINMSIFVLQYLYHILLIMCCR
jgi:hypothetical protein